MNEKKELLEKYQSLIDASKPEEILELFDVITMLQDDDKLNAFIGKYRSQMIQNYSLIWIGKHVHYYLCDDRYMEGLSVLKDYQEAPFISVETEDFMHQLEQEIKKVTMQKKHDPLQKKDIQELLFSNNEAKVMKAIRFLSERNVREYLVMIRKYFLMDFPYKYKVLLEFLLMEQEIDESFTIKKIDGTTFEFIPKKYQFPFAKKEYLEYKEMLYKENEDPSTLDFALEIIDTSLINLFPESIFDKISVNLAEKLSLYLAKKYLGFDIVNLKEHCIKEFSLTEEEFDNYISLIQGNIMN